MTSKTNSLFQEANLLGALDSVPHGIAFLDRNFHIVRMNRFLEAITGYTSSESQGIHADFILRSTLFQKSNSLALVLSQQKTMVVEGDIINRFRKKIPVRFTTAPLYNHFSQILGTILVIEDISSLQLRKKDTESHNAFADIIGHSPKMQEIFELLPLVARTEASVLLTGETGTGKDLLASTIHKTSKRSRYPFIKVNCGALQESLLESELFGHKKGAYTGATSDTPGMFGLADGGTIYLTEIGDLPLPLQVKLLTVLDDKEYYPLGCAKKVKADVRVIAATHHNLQDLVARRQFREDLFYRLNILQLHLPPLREREGDLCLLTDHFLRLFTNPNALQNTPCFAPQTLDLLRSYSYPGNIRELRNIVEYGITISRGETVLPEHLPRYLFVAAHEEQSSSHLPEKDRDGKKTIPEHQTRIVYDASLPWHETEKQLILDALIATNGKKTLAAQRLGWGRTTLWRKIKHYGLDK